MVGCYIFEHGLYAKGSQIHFTSINLEFSVSKFLKDVTYGIMVKYRCLRRLWRWKMYFTTGFYWKSAWRGFRWKPAHVPNII